MTSIAARLAVLLLVTLAAMPARGQEARSQETRSVAPARLLDEVRDFVGKHFFDRNGLSGFEDVLNRQRDANLSQQQVSETIEQALHALKASHTGRYTPDQIEYFELMDIFRPGSASGYVKKLFPPDGTVNYAGIGIAPRKIDGRYFILHVYHGSPADRAGLMAGDEILHVDGKPYEPVGSFAGKTGSSVSVQVRRQADAAPVTVDVPVIRIQPGDMFRDAIRNSARVIEKDGRRVGYVRVWTYAARGVHWLMTELLSSEPLKNADALILDLRSRWGGAPPQSAELFVGRTPDMTMIDRDGKRSVTSIRWRKPVVALIDSGTRSGMEIFAYALKKEGIKLIGTRTAGALLAGRGFLLDDDSLLVLAVNDVIVDGERLEGPGVAPDIEVTHDIRYANGADPLVERAFRELESMRVKVN